MRKILALSFWLVLIGSASAQNNDQKHYRDLKPNGGVFFDAFISDIQNQRLAFEDSAIPILHSAINYYNKEAHPCGGSKSHAVMGRVFYEIGLRDSATLNFHKASKLAKAAKTCNPFELYYLYNSWGIMNYRLEEYAKADSLYNLALDAAKQLENRLPELNVYINQANLLADQKQFANAIKKAKNIFVIASALQFKKQQETSLQNIVAYFIDLNQYDSAKIYVNELSRILTDDSSPDLVMDMHNNKGLIYKNTGMLDSALFEVKTAVLLATQHDKINKKVYYLFNLADINFGLQNYDSAWAQINAHLVLFKKLNDKNTLESIKSKIKAEEYKANILKEQSKATSERLMRNISLLILAIVIIILISVYGRLRYIRRSKIIVEREKKRSDELLRNILPDEVAEELKENGHSDARSFSEVTVLFTDFKDFTSISESLTAEEMVQEINVYFKRFDEIVEQYDIEKIKTIGDSFMAAGGVPVESPDAAKHTVLAALMMQRMVYDRNLENAKNGKPQFEMRIGINTGPVVAGIVGIKKFQYDIWGDTVNTASRMESNGEIGRVNISQTTYDLVKDCTEFTFEKRSKIEVKGKGKMDMYFVSLVS